MIASYTFCRIPRPSASGGSAAINTYHRLIKVRYSFSVPVICNHGGFRPSHGCTPIGLLPLMSLLLIMMGQIPSDSLE